MDYIVFYIFVFIQLCHTKDVGATSGRLTYQEPAIQWRTVTFMFRPDNFNINSNLTMVYDKLGGNRQERHFQFDINDSVYYIHVDTRTDAFNSASFYVNYGGTYSAPKKLTLIKLKGCGHMYVRTKPVVSGKNIELGYFPNDAVISSTHEYVREWYNVTSGDVMQLSEGILTERNETNREYVLTVYNARSWMSGRYKVKCTIGRGENDRFTDPVHISVPPGKPSLYSSNNVSDCTSCVVGKQGENLGEYVYCITTGGTVPTIRIGDQNVSVNTSFEDRYHPYYVTKKDDHMKIVSCSVFNSAIDTPLVSNSTLYVAVEPAEPVLHLLTLKEGEPANITCISMGGRPPSTLSLMIDGRNMSKSSETFSVVDTTTNTYTIRTTLNAHAKRDWNLKYIICTQQTELFYDIVSNGEEIICKYPPLTLFMGKPTLPKGLLEAYSLTVTCTISDFNDNCSLNWNSDQLKLDGKKATVRTDETEETEGLSTLNVNATKRDNGHTLICSVTCSSFQVDISASYTIYVPFAPIMSLSSEQEIILSVGETQQITCTVISYPMSDIIWSSGDTRILEGCKQTKQTNECIATIEHIAADEQRNYTCTAQNQFKNVTEYVVVTGRDVGATCGSLTHQEPAVQGRIVTFVFRPDNFNINSNLTMKYDKPGRNLQERYSRQFPFNINDDVYYIHVDTALDTLHSSFFAVQYDECYSDWKRLTLKKLEGCGHMYVRTKPVVSRRNFELGYFPNDDVIPSTHDYVREWYNVTFRDVMPLSEGILTERNETNREYVLTVYNARSWMSGMYTIKCTNGRPTNVFTNAVDISVIVQPGKPSLHSSIHVSDCKNCVVGKEGEALGEHLYCITTGGTVPTIKIGGQQVSVSTSIEDRYHPYHYVTRKDDHMKVVSCSVYNAAIDTPLVSNSTLYVAVKPAEPVLHLPKLKEGEPANITCISMGGRPASRLSLMIDGKNMSEFSETISVNDSTTNTYTIRTTLNANTKREWNLKYIICTQQTELFNDIVSDGEKIICKYPPLTLFMENSTLPIGLQEAYSLTVTCNMSDFNDNCSLNWNSDQLELDGTKATVRTEETEETEGLSTLILNATKRDNGHTLICSVTCSSFQVDISASHTIYVPFAPIMSLSSEQEIVLSVGESQQITCTVNSYPMSDIIWSSGDTRITEDCKQTKQTNECIATIEHIAADEQRNYTCTAQHQFKNVTEYVVVTGRGKKRAERSGRQNCPNGVQNGEDN